MNADLEAAARAAQASAYAPYSKFKVGAAVLVDGEIYEGVNVENASYPLGVCAERNAIAAAVTAGGRHLEEVAVFTDASPPSSPGTGSPTRHHGSPRLEAIPTAAGTPLSLWLRSAGRPRHGTRRGHMGAAGRGGRACG